MKKLYIKYMVSHRCKLKVKEELQKLGLNYVTIDLGVAETLEEISPDQRNKLRVNLKKSGLELLDDKRKVIVEKIILAINEMIYGSAEEPSGCYSEYLSQKIGYDYSYLANIFSEVKGSTIQQYIIFNRIERAKEFLLSNEISLSEIAFRMNYSSVAHLSNQFKKTTGHSPTYYKLQHKKITGGLSSQNHD